MRTRVWSILLAGAGSTIVLSHSIHVVMFDVLGIPSAPGYPLVGFLPYLTYVALSFAAIVFWRLARRRVAPLPMPLQGLVLFLILAMLREQVLRAPVMDGVVTGAWRYAVLSNLPKLLPFLALGCLVAPTSHRLTRWWMKAAAAAGFAGVFVFVRAEALALSAPLLDRFAYLAHDEIYKPPYDFHVDLPSYLAFSEPVAAGFVVAALVWDRLSPNVAMRFFQFAVLLLAMNRTLFGPLVYAAAMPREPWAAMMEFGQFWLQALAQALLTGGVWMAACREARAGRDSR